MLYQTCVLLNQTSPGFTECTIDCYGQRRKEEQPISSNRELKRPVIFYWCCAGILQKLQRGA